MMKRHFRIVVNVGASAPRTLASSVCPNVDGVGDV
jgi:hypothetical protein